VSGDQLNLHHNTSTYAAAMNTNPLNTELNRYEPNPLNPELNLHQHTSMYAAAMNLTPYLVFRERDTHTLSLVILALTHALTHCTPPLPPPPFPPPLLTFSP
jgi:hypothetical protein